MICLTESTIWNRRITNCCLCLLLANQMHGILQITYQKLENVIISNFAFRPENENGDQKS